jgi:hypothetical protein
MKRLLPLAALLLAACPKPAAPPPAHDARGVLDRMDTRIPVPLLAGMANHQLRDMRDHLLAVQEIVAGAAKDDFAAIEAAAYRIGTKTYDEASCQRMGLGAPGFSEQSIKFHRSADVIAVAATKRDRAEVLSALNRTLETCTACHAAFKQQVVDDATWSRLTSTGR